jgi:hypothetical protein
MKTLILTTAIAMMMSFNLSAAPEGIKDSANMKVEIYQTNPESVDVYVAKTNDDLIKIKIYTETGSKLMVARVKKQSSRHIRFYMNELPEGKYFVCVEKDNETISKFTVNR